jgi:hypothetical protein
VSARSDTVESRRFGEDALQPHAAGVLEGERAITVQMLGKSGAGGRERELIGYT